jgi:hypothetical protein
VSAWSPSDLLPGLCFLALAAALAAALRRWLDPLPLRILAVFVLLVSVLLGSSLFGGRILLPLGNLVGAVPYRFLPPPPPGNWLQGDLIHQITPWALEVRRAVFDGRWPLWNARGGAGMPLLGDPQSQAFQPLVAAAYLLPVCQAAAVTSALRVFIALVFSFLFLRRQRLGEAAALCGALAYGLGGFLLLWLGWPIGNGAALLPALLYALVRVDEERGRRDSVLLFLVTAAVLLGGHPETQLYELSCTGVFLLARTAARSARRERRALIFRAGLAMGLAAAAMAPVLLPVSGYLPETHRATLIRFHLQPRPLGTMMEELAKPETRAQWAKEAAQRVLPVFAPRAFGDLGGDYWGGENFIEDTSGCVGAAALFAALLALVPLRLQRTSGGSRFPQERLAIGILLVSLALLAQPPGFEILFGRLPVIGATAIHHHHRMLLLVNLAVAWLAACTVERWVRGEVRRLAAAAVGAATAGLIAWAYVAHPSETGRVVYGLLEGGLAAQLAAVGLTLGLLLVRVRPPEPPPPPSPPPRVPPPPAPSGRGAPPPKSQEQKGEQDESLRQTRAGVPPLPFGVGVWWHARERGPGGEGGLVGSTAGFGGSCRWAPYALAAVIAAELFGLYGTVNSAMPAEYAYPTAPSIAFLQRRLGPYRFMGLGQAFLPNIPLFYGLRDVRIDNPSLPTAYAALTSPLSRSPMVPRFGRPVHPLYDLLAVRYIAARAGVPLPYPLVYRDPEVWIYERPGALPLLFLPARARVYRGMASWLVWVEENTDFAARALVQPSPERWQSWRSRPADGSTLTLTSFGPALLRAHATLGETRLLASSIYQDGNWLLLDGGVRAPTLLTNGPFLGAWLAEGEHDLQLLYRPWRFVAGCILAALALAAAAALWVPPPPPRSPAVLS